MFCGEHLDLTGAKRACDRGECGACTVLVEKQPMLACHLLALQVRGRQIRTVEGLAEQDDFRPILEAFTSRCGAVWLLHAGVCGGHVCPLTTSARGDRMAARWELVGAYLPLQRVRKYCQQLSGATTPLRGQRVMESTLTVVGVAVPRLGLAEKVQGRARYTADLKRPGMLYGRVLRSPHAHARITHVEVSAARRLPGACGAHTRRCPASAPRCGLATARCRGALCG